MSIKQLATAPEQSPIGKALRQALVPMVDFFLKERVTYPAFESMLQEVFVERATAHKSEANGSVPDLSSLVWITGMDAKQVKRVQHELNADEARRVTSPEVSYEMLVIEAWKTPMFCSDDGEPLPLPVQAATGRTFKKLVKYAIGSSRGYERILSSLKRAGCIADCQDGSHGRVVALTRQELTIENSDHEIALQIAADAIGSLTNSLSRSIRKRGRPTEVGWSHQTVSCRNVPPERLAQFRAELNDVLKKQYASLREEFGDLQEQTGGHAPNAESARVGCGIYYFED